jgi:glutamine amidotransferase
MIALIDYGAGNLRSVENALKRLGVAPTITSDKAVIASAERVIFPGVGHAAAAMQMLRAQGLDTTIGQLRQPVLGICLGMQLLCAHTDEGDTPCLGISPARVVKFGAELRVPHMGWNSITGLKGPLFRGIEEDTDFYFVHSYAVEVDGYTTATSSLGVDFAAALQKDNFYGVQFHPEKSAAAGEQILKNFLEL